ncbi:hypothetical protein CF319_g9382 [Tilletia indica]|nr:hypothetical protein CF319_g9382 [Tilletia indica]
MPTIFSETGMETVVDSGYLRWGGDGLTKCILQTALFVAFLGKDTKLDPRAGHALGQVGHTVDLWAPAPVQAGHGDRQDVVQERSPADLLVLGFLGDRARRGGDEPAGVLVASLLAGLALVQAPSTEDVAGRASHAGADQDQNGIDPRPECGFVGPLVNAEFRFRGHLSAQMEKEVT